MNLVWFFETSGTTDPTTQHHISEDLNFQQLLLSKLKILLSVRKYGSLHKNEVDGKQKWL